ncbi:cupin domain-containing protein [Robertkochia flava]|uniref:cupin domain-containing protein n=1 Tax=Robertkochia flava TaxID=3447986 RepID=UPI001CC9AE66|nr:cupin domain-containing protein [Robertkochia marina]
MAVIHNFKYVSVADLDDPDDYRPDSYLSFSTDPGKEGERVENMVVFREKIAPGDQIPLHMHTSEEVMMVDKGTIEARLGNKKQIVQQGGVIFIGAKQAHGFKNVGDVPARISAVFPSRYVDIFYLERNPAPGTEAQNPQPPVRIDIRALSDGNPEQAIEVIPESLFSQ